jgi:hypothetical protein
VSEELKWEPVIESYIAFPDDEARLIVEFTTNYQWTWEVKFRKTGDKPIVVANGKSVGADEAKQAAEKAYQEYGTYDQPTTRHAALRALAEYFILMRDQLSPSPFAESWSDKVPPETVLALLDTADRHAALVAAVLRGEWNEAARLARETGE